MYVHLFLLILHLVLFLFTPTSLDIPLFSSLFLNYVIFYNHVRPHP